MQWCIQICKRLLISTTNSPASLFVNLDGSLMRKTSGNISKWMGKLLDYEQRFSWTIWYKQIAASVEIPSFIANSSCSTNQSTSSPPTPLVLPFHFQESEEGGEYPKERKTVSHANKSFKFGKHMFHLFWPSPKIFQWQLGFIFLSVFPQVWALFESVFERTICFCQETLFNMALVKRITWTLEYCKIALFSITWHFRENKREYSHL